MPRFVFSKIEIDNFKYIKSGHPISINFECRNIVILGGQNGYGKTTLFDSIELLLNGTIKHFNPELLNRGAESIGVLANDQNRDIIVKGWISSDEGSNVNIIRTFKSDEDFSSTILWNDNKITQEELYNRLKTSRSLLDIGTYISQSQSLNFLQNKYKNRKEQVSSLLETPEITEKIQFLREIQQKLKERTDKKVDELQKQKYSVEAQVIQFEKQADIISKSTPLEVEYIKLFQNKEYPFDSNNFMLDTTYTAFIGPLMQIEAFIKNYDEYIKYIQNRYIDKALGIAPQVYMSLFYAKQNKVLNDNKSLIDTISRIKILLGQFNQHIWSVDLGAFIAIGVPESLTEQLKLLIETKQLTQKSLNDTDRALVELNKARNSLIRQFDIVSKQGAIDENSCPLCGTKFSDIQKVFDDTGKSLSNIHEDGVKQVNQIELQIEKIFIQEIIPKLENFLTENNQLIRMNDALNSCKNLSYDELSELLKKLGITDFVSLQLSSFSIDEYTTSFEKLKTLLINRKKPSNIVISDEELELYKSIHYNYYGNNPPSHTLEQLQNKRKYIANCFLNDVNKKLTETKTQLKQVTEELKRYEDKNSVLQDAIRTLIKKYEDSNKEYQSTLANAIRLPLFIYSGKIIQNYPLGLGVKAVVKTNQLVFESESKEGIDVYNILSTGQLNGLAIAILLSVRNIYGNSQGLDILLIDDPLQTIDDISSISLADLLTQQHIGQIILSTHEEKKARLLKFKFDQEHLSVLEKNMQKIYLDAKQ